MPVIGDIVAPEDLGGLEIPQGVVAVWGELWDGTPVIRGVRNNQVTVLRGEFGSGFHSSGPCASLCKECSQLILHEGFANVQNMQRHYSREHGVALAMLP